MDSKEYLTTIKKMIADGVISQEAVDKYFPGLADSEDEKVRKEIAGMVNFFYGTHLGFKHSFSKDEMLDYLEKQRDTKRGWSEKDKKMLKSVLWHVSYSVSNGKSTDISCDLTDWLNELIDRVQSQPKQELSEKDEKFFNILISLANNPSADGMFEYHQTNKSDFNNWVKGLKDRCQSRPQKQCDYNPYKAVVESIAKMCEKYEFTDEKGRDFLNNIKVKCKEAKQYDSMFPQSQWKPTKEQLEALDSVIYSYDGHCGSDPTYGVVVGLYEELKKL